MRRILNTHEPLRHAVVGLADAAHLAVRPELASDPLDNVVEVVLLSAAKEFKLSLGNSSSADIGMHVSVAFVHIPLDRPSFAPEKKRRRRKNVIVVPIGRARKKRRERAGTVRPIYPHPHFGSIGNPDRQLLLINHLISSSTVRFSAMGRTQLYRNVAACRVRIVGAGGGRQTLVRIASVAGGSLLLSALIHPLLQPANASSVRTGLPQLRKIRLM